MTAQGLKATIASGDRFLQKQAFKEVGMWRLLFGFLIGTWGFFAHQAWWSSSALTAAILSSVMILLWWTSLNISSAFFALVFNIVVFVVVLWQQRAFQPAGV